MTAYPLHRIRLRLRETNIRIEHPPSHCFAAHVLEEPCRTSWGRDIDIHIAHCECCEEISSLRQRPMCSNLSLRSTENTADEIHCDGLSGGWHLTVAIFFHLVRDRHCRSEALHSGHKVFGSRVDPSQPICPRLEGMHEVQMNHLRALRYSCSFQ